MHVLIVDDSEVYRRSVADTLTDLLQATVSQAGDGLEALRRLEGDEPVDLVLLDLRMPGMDGLELSRRVAARPGRPRLLVMTAHEEADAGEAARQAGADGFVCKTDGVAALLAGIQQVLAQPLGFEACPPQHP